VNRSSAVFFGYKTGLTYIYMCNILLYFTLILFNVSHEMRERGGLVVVVGVPVKTLHLTQKRERGLWWVVVGVKPSCVSSEGGVGTVVGCENPPFCGRWWWM